MFTSGQGDGISRIDAGGVDGVRLLVSSGAKVRKVGVIFGRESRPCPVSKCGRGGNELRALTADVGNWSRSRVFEPPTLDMPRKRSSQFTRQPMHSIPTEAAVTGVHRGKSWSPSMDDEEGKQRSDDSELHNRLRRHRSSATIFVEGEREGVGEN